MEWQDRQVKCEETLRRTGYTNLPIMISLNICVRCCFLTLEIKWRAPLVKSFQDEAQAVFNYATSAHLWIINRHLLPGWQWLTESYQWFQAKDMSLSKGYLHEDSKRAQGLADTQNQGTGFPGLQVFGVPNGQWNPSFGWWFLQGLLRCLPSAVFIGSLFLLRLL